MPCHDGAEKVVATMKNRTLRTALNSWYEALADLRRKRGLMARIRARFTNALLASGFATWRARMPNTRGGLVFQSFKKYKSYTYFTILNFVYFICSSRVFY